MCKEKLRTTLKDMHARLQGVQGMLHKEGQEKERLKARVEYLEGEMRQLHSEYEATKAKYAQTLNTRITWKGNFDAMARHLRKVQNASLGFLSRKRKRASLADLKDGSGAKMRRLGFIKKATSQIVATNSIRRKEQRVSQACNNSQRTMTSSNYWRKWMKERLKHTCFARWGGCFRLC